MSCNTSHKTQPLDVTFYVHLKITYDIECSKYLKNHLYEQITPNFSTFSYLKMASSQSAVKGLAKTDFCLYNFVFTDYGFLRCELRETNNENMTRSVAVGNLQNFFVAF